MKKSALTLFFLLVLLASNAQNNAYVLNLKFHDNSILIRWAPNNYSNWKKSIDSGYILQRISFDDLSNENGNWQTLTPQSIKPDNLETMKTKFGADNKNAALAAQMLYGKTSVNSNNGDLQDLISNTKVEQDNKYGFMMLACSKDFDVAVSVGLGFKDTKVDANTNYAYRLIALGIDTVYTTIKLKYKEEYDYILPNVLVENQEMQSTFTWSIEDSPFWGYYIERRINNEGKWIKTSTSPLVMLNTIKDSIKSEPLMIVSQSFERNYEQHQFRLIGIDDYGIENFGQVFSAQGEDKTPPSAPDNNRAEGVDENTIKVFWTWDALLQANDLKGFRIDKATSTDFYFQPYSEILNPNTRSFLDKKPVRLGNNYYRVAAIDTAGNESYSVFAYGMVYDSVAPSAPQNIQFSIDSNGVVKLRWDKPKEIDVYGYRVYFSNYYNHKFINLTGNPIDTNYFSDTISLKTLSKKAFYKIVALDYNFNHSGYSEPIEILRPDKIKPQAPFFIDYYTDGKLVKLNWRKSYSDDADLVVLKRKINGTDSWDELFKGDNFSDTSFIDTNVRQGFIYDYEIIVVDKEGLISETERVLTVKTIPMQRLVDVQNLKVKYDEEKNKVLLSWSYGVSEQVYFIIYRSEDGISFNELDYVENTFNFTDATIKKEMHYYYTVKPVSRNGASGKQSTMVDLIIK